MSTPTLSPATQSTALSVGLRVAVGSSLCLVASKWFHWDQAALGVYTVHLALVLFPYTAIQKVLERLVGRLTGVAYGLVLLIFFQDTPWLFLFLLLVGQQAFFYVNASGHFGYASLMGGLFTGVIAAKGLISPSEANAYAGALVIQLILGGVAVVIVNFVTGAERTLHIETKGDPLWPLRADWLNKAAMVSTAQLGAMFLASILELPVLPTMITVSILAISTNEAHAMRFKGYQRALGALLGASLGGAGLLMLALIPYFSLLVVFSFFGMFVAAYHTKVQTTYSYTFLQMGMVFPMVLIGSSGMVGTVETGVQRLIGVAAGLAASEFVFLIWPVRWGLTAPPVPWGDPVPVQRR
jgi:uncharacterized membrane protein YccC